MVAVSGGVDSVALLYILKNLSGLELVMAHFDHGIREESSDDRVFVQNLAAKYELPFVSEKGGLGPKTSEATARKARYDFLRKVQENNSAKAIVTAHHQDDVLETAIINLLRGSNRKGLTSLASRPGIERPLLKVPKQDLISYAKGQGLIWREDATNQDKTYLRNYVRHNIVPRLGLDSRAQLLEIIKNQQITNQELDTLLAKQLATQTREGGLNRLWFTSLPHDMAKEVLASWLRSHGVRDFDSKTLERLVVAAKVARPSSSFDVLHKRRMLVSNDHLALSGKER